MRVWLWSCHLQLGGTCARMNCVCDFSISHYFAELDSMHMPLTFVAECLQRALRRTGCGVFLPIITQQLLKLLRISPSSSQRCSATKSLSSFCELAKVRGSIMAINEAAQR